MKLPRKQINLPYTTSTYAALAKLRGCEFWTADRAFYNAVHADLPFVHYLAEYP